MSEMRERVGAGDDIAESIRRLELPGGRWSLAWIASRHPVRSSWATEMATNVAQRPGAVVGRKRELAELDRALGRLANHQPWVIQLVGEPGIGKSRLLAELARRAEARRCLAVIGRAAEFEQDVPFGAIIDALNDHLGALDSAVVRALEPQALQELAHVFPSLSGFADETSAPRGQADRYRFHYALRAVLERLAARRPVLIVFDDVHWADPASCEVIAHLLRRFRGPLLMALAVRHTPSPLAAPLEEAIRAGEGARVDLGPLSSAEAHALIDPELDAPIREALYRESGGNPFYLEQLARVRPRLAGPAATTVGPTESWTLPPAVAVAIEDELSRIHASHKLVLDAAAVVGESFEPELVAPIAERSVEFTLQALDQLVRADIIRGTTMPRRFRFRHPIVRRAVYDGIPSGWRLAAHARAAASLIAARAPASTSAHHVERSAMQGDELAVAVLVEAARGAASRAPLGAGRWLLAALRLLPTEASPERRMGLLTEAATALASGGAYDEALAALEESLALVPSDQAEVRADVTAKIAYVKRRSGRPFDSRPVLEHALESLTDSDGKASADLRLELALHSLWHDEFAALTDLAQPLLRLARAQNDLAMVALSGALCSLGSLEPGAPAARRALAEAEGAFAALSDEQLAGRVYVSFYLGLAELRLERADEALRHTNRGLEVGRLTGQGVTVTSWLAITSRAALLKGQVADATRLGHDAIDTERLLANDWRTIWALEADSLAAFWAGDSDRALASAREMATRAERIHPFLSGPATVQLAGAEYAAADAASAYARLTALDTEPARRALDRNSAHGWELLIRSQLALGRTDDAKKTVARALSRAEAAGLTQQIATVRCAEAAVLLASGDPDRASTLLEEAVTLADAAGNPLLSARGRALAAIALIARGDGARGVGELTHAERTLFACGARREADAAARELRRLGQSIPRRTRPSTRRPGLAALSRRENEIAAEVASGKTNREVAAALFLSEKTVGNHLTRIFEKLDVHSRAALATLVGREASAPAAEHASRRRLAEP
jgi:DNA-binding CsgD family transcriptional regulator